MPLNKKWFEDLSAATDKVIAKYKGGVMGYDDKQPASEYDGPNQYDCIVSALETTEPAENAELIESAIDTLAAALKGKSRHADNDIEKAAREALATLRELYMVDSDDPRLNGWVDDRGRP